MSSAFVDSLRPLMIKHFGSVAAFARAADLPATTVYNILNRGIEGATWEVVNRIYDTLQIDWKSVKVDGPAVSKMDSPASKPAPEVSNGHFRAVPVVLAVAAGEPDMWTVDRHMDVPEEVMSKHPEAYLVRVVGDSVNRRILDGYYALVDPKLTDPNDHDLFAVCVNGDAATIKRLHKLAHGIELIPDSYDPTIRPIVYDENEESDPEVTIMGKVVYAVMPLDYSI